ncbi:ABC transporter substrate-binding protein [Hyphomicrobium sp. LHD-15]|uniref:ABC transporter substrate-binding protein n=1 Tax=Hyphomicrobium sp. LHD-15 TaxID=3072142 RepID=UPI0028102ADA|nr:ABC transporter substrate-binding protein [Hyphomicrobium sp. LHD-15]MDQ8700611.1 ABC transporter substrate-binding protein [Hyphomicrobium sp. LHD-15]
MAMVTRTVVAALAATTGLWSPAVQAERVSVVDALGRTVEIATPPQRIVTVFSSNTELVAALGLADRIVGIDAMTPYPPEIVGKPHIGGRLGFSVDAVVAQRPDLVIVTPARQAANQLVEPMQRVGVPVIVLTARTMAEVMANLRLLGRATGQMERGEKTADELKKRLAAVAERNQNSPLLRAVMITGRLGNGLFLIARPNTYTGDAMRIAGTVPALPTLTTLAQVSPEAILAASPDVILFAGGQEDLDDLLVRPGWRDLVAVKQGRAWTVPRAEWLIPGPRTVDGIERLARQLHTGH